MPRRPDTVRDARSVDVAFGRAVTADVRDEILFFTRTSVVSTAAAQFETRLFVCNIIGGTLQELTCLFFILLFCEHFFGEKNLHPKFHLVIL